MRRRPRSLDLAVKRFKPSKVAGTGNDPNGAYTEFIRRDPITNIDIHRDMRPVPPLPPRDGPALGCTKIFRRSTSPERPKVDYKLTTDHISFASPASPNQSFTVARRDLTEAGWAPKRTNFTYCNKESTNYDPISFIPRSHPSTSQAAKIDARRTKGIAEYVDLMHQYNSNFTPSYASKLDANPRVYYRKTGIFTHMYDASARQGYITQPFERHSVGRDKV
mmetsp:Transcript_9543/g.18580  ORF Transcript_9543/g.18580 Transcript_9543/m.18580 type:complete len:221 (+) Transcript_9543:4938-5600(+)